MEEIPVEKIVRSRRRTIALEITSGATLVVRAPLRASVADIEEIIRLKRLMDPAENRGDKTAAVRTLS